MALSESSPAPERQGEQRFLANALAAADTLAANDRSASTWRAYRSDFRDFEAFCLNAGVPPLPATPETVGAYLTSLVSLKLKAATIRRRAAAIGFIHARAGLQAPTAAQHVKSVLSGICRQLGTASAQKAPATNDILATLMRQIPSDTLAGLRDRALLLLGFAGALRRSEIVGLDVEHIERVREGAILHIGKSKTDQEGRGQTVPIPKGRTLRPLAALDEWITAAGIIEGAVFRRIRSGDRLTADRLAPAAVAAILKRHAEAARLDPAEFAGHSLRAGFLTSALEHGADLFAAADQGRWKKLETVRGYDRRRKMFRNHAGSGFL